MDSKTIPAETERFPDEVFDKYKELIKHPFFNMFVLSSKLISIKDGKLFWSVEDDDPYILVVDPEVQTINLVYAIDEPLSYLNLLSPSSKRDRDIVIYSLEQILDALTTFLEQFDEAVDKLTDEIMKL
ncbi:MAG TPA: hypothetical protein PLI45_02640 [Candidatus Woesebacteria bacterium]|nr:hypothetical protein [Candidatus Woesebacteria bacterium]